MTQLNKGKPPPKKNGRSEVYASLRPGEGQLSRTGYCQFNLKHSPKPHTCQTRFNISFSDIFYRYFSYTPIVPQFTNEHNKISPALALLRQAEARLALATDDDQLIKHYLIWLALWPLCFASEMEASL